MYLGPFQASMMEPCKKIVAKIYKLFPQEALSLMFDKALHSHLLL